MRDGKRYEEYRQFFYPKHNLVIFRDLRRIKIKPDIVSV